MQPYYHDNLTTLYHGDCLDVMAELAPASFDAIICDPPYGTTACKWDSVIPFEPMWAALRRLARPRAAIVLFGQEPFSSLLRVSNLEQYKYDWIWEKPVGTGFLDANERPLKCHELISVFYDSEPTYNPQKWLGQPNHSAKTTIRHTKSIYAGSYGRPLPDMSGLKYPRSVIRFAKHSAAERLHENQKPLALLEYLVKTYTDEGQTVLDFTSGSGTTLRAAKNLKRRSVGIELHEPYCAATVKRLAPAFEAALVDDGAALDDLSLFAMRAAD